MLCGIADVYDAMRSQRAYQQAFPSDRILARPQAQRRPAVRSDTCVRRFVQLIGIYPVGNLVRLEHRRNRRGRSRCMRPTRTAPQVKVIVDRSGAHL